MDLSESEALMRMDLVQVNYRTIGNRIRRERKLKHITQDALAQKVNVNAGHISNIENCHTKVSLETLVKICNALGVTLDYIMASDCINPSSAIDSQILVEVRNCDDKAKEQILQIIRSFL